MSWLVVSWFFTFGYLPQNNAIYKQEKNYIINEMSESFEQTMGLEAKLFDRVRIWNDYQVFDFSATETFGFCPFQNNYRIGVEFYTPNLVFGLKHECIHPVTSNFWDDPVQMGGNTTEFYITLRGTHRF